MMASSDATTIGRAQKDTMARQQRATRCIHLQGENRKHHVYHMYILGSRVGLYWHEKCKDIVQPQCTSRQHVRQPVASTGHLRGPSESTDSRSPHHGYRRGHDGYVPSRRCERPVFDSRTARVIAPAPALGASCSAVAAVLPSQILGTLRPIDEQSALKQRLI